MLAAEISGHGLRVGELYPLPEFLPELGHVLFGSCSLEVVNVDRQQDLPLSMEVTASPFAIVSHGNEAYGVHVSFTMSFPMASAVGVSV